MKSAASIDKVAAKLEALRSARVQEILRLARLGMPNGRIAKAVGVSRQRVQQVKKRYGG